MKTPKSSDLILTISQIASLAENHLNPSLGGSNTESVFMDCWAQCAASGLLGIHISPEFGGLGEDVMSSVMAMEALGEHCIDNGFSFAINTTLFSHASTLAASGNPEQKHNYLKPLCLGEKICAYAITEEDAGSDAHAIKTLAQEVDGGFLLEGQKTYITLGPLADFALVFASTNPEHRQWGLTAFIVDIHSEGARNEPLEKSGLKTIPMGKLQFESCFVPNRNVLGKVGGGAAVFEESQIWERSFIMASQVGAMKRQLDAVISYANERSQFGKAIGQFQSVSNRIADMRLRLETAKLMLYNVARLKDSGNSIRLESALLKIHLSETFLENSLDAVRIHGAKGYTGTAEPFTNLADSVAGLIMAGTNDIQRGIVSRLLGV